MNKTGTVYLVGAGPGDPQLLTLRGAELLRRADVVVLDALASPELLRLCRAGVELIQRRRDQPMPQAELTALLVEHARAGRMVVRLKGGDPYIFGRGGEEAEGLASSGVPFEVVPGVSSIAAVPNYAGVPLTHREHCSSFTVVTGHEDPTRPDNPVDWDRLAAEPGTKVVLMGVDRLAQLTEALLSRGLAADTPAMLVAQGTTGRQRSVDGTLGTLARLAREAGLMPPAVAVIGSVVGLRPQLNWFESRPLFGQRVVVTRAASQAAELSERLWQRGAEVLEVPCIKIAPPSERTALVEALAGLHGYDWLVFTSVNGVTMFFEAFFKAFSDLRDLGGVRIAAVGPATRAQLEALHLQVNAMPKEYVAKEVARALAAEGSLENLRILLPRAEVANRELPKLLEDMGAIVDDTPCYQTVIETEDVTGHAARMMKEGAEWITFTSGSTVRNFHQRFDLPRFVRQYPHVKLASVGPETTKVIQELNLSPTVEARPHTMEGLVEAMIAKLRGRRRG